MEAAGARGHPARKIRDLVGERASPRVGAPGSQQRCGPQLHEVAHPRRLPGTARVTTLPDRPARQRIEPELDERKRAAERRQLSFRGTRGTLDQLLDLMPQPLPLTDRAQTGGVALAHRERAPRVPERGRRCVVSGLIEWLGTRGDGSPRELARPRAKERARRGRP
jgi:hypothetical protein